MPGLSVAAVKYIPALQYGPRCLIATPLHSSSEIPIEDTLECGNSPIYAIQLQVVVQLGSRAGSIQEESNAGCRAK